MNPLKPRRDCFVGSRVTHDTKDALEEIKSHHGYSSGDLLEMTANNLLYNEKREIRNSLEKIILKRNILEKYQMKITKILSDMNEELDGLTQQRDFLEEQLDLHGYTEDEDLMKARDAYLTAIERRQEKMKVSFDTPVSSEDELLVQIANNFGVKPVMLKKVVTWVSNV